MDKYTLISDDLKKIRLFVFYAALLGETNDVNVWFINYGAILHMTCNKDFFDEYYEDIDGTYVYLGDKISPKDQGYGVVGVNFPNGQK